MARILALAIPEATHLTAVFGLYLLPREHLFLNGRQESLIA